jgi:two-component system cell cycle sensor histidine kinase/response regulator CckA
VLDLSEVARGLAPMLRRLIGDDIEVEMALSDALPEVLADAGQLEQVVINLAVNARDAMPEGGLLVVATGVEGDHVWLSVSDTGIGIAPEALPHVFEPFYTTKPVGAGTGLGLASVHGAITQSGGRIEVDSEPGHGTTFKFLLPATHAQRDAAVPERPASEDWLGGDETILVCEDEDGVRALVELVLVGAGYRVLSEGRPSAALARAEEEPGHIHGLVTDVIMPDMPGPELARRLGGTRPGLRTLFISGYTADTVRERGSLPAGSAFLEKPFDRATLLRTLRELLTTT